MKLLIQILENETILQNCQIQLIQKQKQELFNQIKI